MVRLHHKLINAVYTSTTLGDKHGVGDQLHLGSSAQGIHSQYYSPISLFCIFIDREATHSTEIMQLVFFFHFCKLRMKDFVLEVHQH